MKYNLIDISISIPADVTYILNTLLSAGYEAYIVGGCVRDSILGRIPGDWDITTSALPEEVKGLFSTTIDTGIKHGTVMVIRHGRGYEVTTYRIDGEYKDGRHPESVQFTRSLNEDLKRRDFTVNAFAYSPEDGVIDLFGGIGDLNNGFIRAVGDPRQRFDEDALRIMRAVRFSAQLSFSIEAKTEAAISEFAPRLAMVSEERIRVEFEKTLFSPNPEKVNRYRDLGLAEYIIPDHSDRCFDDEVSSLYSKVCYEPNAAVRIGISDADAGSGSTSADDLSKYEKILRLALFFRNLSPDECSGVMRKMTFDNYMRRMVCHILEHKDAAIPINRVDIKLMLKAVGAEVFILICRFRNILGEETSGVEAEFANIISSGEPYNISMLAINGKDLIDAGMPSGPQLGQTLEKMLNIVISEPSLNTKENLIRLCR